MHPPPCSCIDIRCKLSHVIWDNFVHNSIYITGTLDSARGVLIFQGHPYRSRGSTVYVPLVVWFTGMFVHVLVKLELKLCMHTRLIIY